MNKRFLVKIIAVLIIQALFLTQADFVLASIYHSKDTFKEAALAFNRVSSDSISFVIGAVDYRAEFNLKSLFGVLQGKDILSNDTLSIVKPCNITNEIYKVLSSIFIDVNSVKLVGVLYKNIIDTKKNIAISRTEESTGPPTVNAKLIEFSKDRIV